MGKKNILKGLIFAIGFVMIFVALQNILTAKWIFQQGKNEGETQRFQYFYDIPKNSLDYITFGPSLSYYSTNPIEIYCESGWKGYDLGSPSQGIAISYYWIKEACKYQQPKIIFLEPTELFLNTKSGTTTNVTKALTNMKFSRNKLEGCIDCSSDEKNTLEYLFPMLAFHDRWSDLKQEDFLYKKEPYFVRGTYLSFYKINNSNIENKNKREINIYNLNGLNEKTNLYCSNENEKYLSWIVSLCNLNEIKLVFYMAPSTYETDEYREQVNKIAQKYKIEVLNYGDCEIAWDWDKDTGDTGHHVNYWGNAKFSNAISDYLLAYEEKGKEDEYWNEDVLQYQKFEETYLISNQDEVKAFFMTLESAKTTHTIIFSVKDEACSGWNEVNEYYINKLGLKGNFSCEHSQQSYIGVVHNGANIFEKWDSAPMQFIADIGGKHLDVTSRGYVYGDSAKIKIDGVDYALNSRGLNIVAIDNVTGQIDVSVAIDTHTSQQDISFNNEKYNSLWREIKDTDIIIEDGVYVICPYGEELESLDICNGLADDEVNCQLWTTTKEIPQQFYIEYIGKGLYTIQAACSGKYLTALDYGNVNCTNVVQDSYTGLANQKWFIYETAENGYTIKNLYNGLVMDVSGTISAPGVNIQLYENNYGDWQKFTFERVGDV